MLLFHLGIFPDVAPRRREATTSEGPFIVAARDEWSARMLITLNYAIPVLSRPGEETVLNIWNDHSASFCEIIASNREDDIRQCLDVGSSYLSHPRLFSEGEEVAHMVWWACRPGDKCPIERTGMNIHSASQVAH